MLVTLSVEERRNEERYHNILQNYDATKNNLLAEKNNQLFNLLN